MTENQRDSGLVRAVGPFAFAAALINAIVGSAIFVVPAALSATIGPYAPLAFLVCAVAMGAIAVCFAEGGSRIPTSGGIYGYVEAAFGPLCGYVAGTLLWFGNVLACGGVAAALADLTASVVPAPYSAATHAATIIGVVGGIALLNVAGAVHGARLASVATVLKLVPLAIFIVAGASAMHWKNLTTVAQPNVEGFGRAMLLGLFAFTGMEITLSGSGEVARPARTIPRALAWALGVVTLLYVAVQLVAQGVLGAALAQSPAPLADAMARIHPLLRWLMLSTAAISMFGWMSSDFLGSPRMLFAFARDGLLPHILGRVHARYHTPYTAIICYAALAIALALSGTFAELAVLATLTSAALYSAGCAAAWLLARRGIAHAGTPLNSRWLGPAAAVGIGGMVAMITLAARAEILGLLALMALGAIIYTLSARWAVARL